MFGKNLVPEIWTKMLFANQISVFLNKQNLQNKSINYRDFLHVNTNPKKINFD